MITIPRKRNKKGQFVPQPFSERLFKKRFWIKVERRGSNECWNWLGAKSIGGYGKILYKNRLIPAHRVAWRFAHGPIPPQLFVCHHCDNPLCCNSTHLFLGTMADNTRDMLRKGRDKHPRGEQHARAKLTKEQVLEIRASQLNQTKTARIYGVSQQTISCIRAKKGWIHLDGYTLGSFHYNEGR